MSDSIKVFINNFNYLTWPKAMAEYLASIPGVEVVIVDNRSTYEPLLKWYNICPFRVVRLDQNLGPLAAWISGTVEREAGRYYVVTDPDLDISQVPRDLMAVLQAGLKAYPDMNKIGFSLELRDLAVTVSTTRDVVRWEQQFWLQPHSDPRFFRAAIGTTFAMYERDREPWGGNSLRTAHPYTARHLPWYGPEDEEAAYYRATARAEFVSWPIRAPARREVWNSLPLADAQLALIARFAGRRHAHIKQTGKYLVAILIPSRGRAEMLRRCVQSFIDATEDLDQVQFVIKADDDDPGTWEACGRLLVPNKVLVISPRGRGYADLHHFYDQMRRAADATWLISWNDDVEMLTRGWDRLIAEVDPPAREPQWYGSEEVCALFFSDGGLFPALTSTMVDVMGCWSKNTHQDSYLSSVAAHVRCMCPMADIRTAHLRGQPEYQDDIFRETQAAYGVTSPTFDLPETATAIWKDARQLIDYILQGSSR